MSARPVNVLRKNCAPDTSVLVEPRVTDVQVLSSKENSVQVPEALEDIFQEAFFRMA